MNIEMDCKLGWRLKSHQERKKWIIIKKGMKHLEGVFLERKFDSENLCTIPKKPKSAFFFIESAVFPPMQLESKKGHFGLTNEELLMIIKYMNYQTSLFWQTILVARIHILNLVFLSLIFVFFLYYQFIVAITISILVFSLLGIMI